MHKINLSNKKISFSLLNLLAIILIIFFIVIDIAYASDNNWVEVSRTITGIQYWDKDSLIIKDKGLIEITTKYLELDPSNWGEVEVNIYTMEINCIGNKYKDISVNGQNNVITKWEDPKGDKLINDVITESCKNGKIY
tara:strand:- start:344 stop:757 length:414 start_codon:yes stop_codon:yes gene_type:complete